MRTPFFISIGALALLRWTAACAAMGGERPDLPAVPPVPCFDVLLHLDECQAEEGFPNGSRRFFLRQQDGDRNDGDARLRLWMPPSGALLTPELELEPGAALEMGVGCEFFDSAWPDEGSDERHPVGARIVTEFSVEWVGADGATTQVSSKRVEFVPEQASDGRVRVDVRFALAPAAGRRGRLRLRTTRAEGPADDLSILPTLWGPVVTGARCAIRNGADGGVPGTLRRSDVIVDLLDPRLQPSVRAEAIQDLRPRSVIDVEVVNVRSLVDARLLSIELGRVTTVQSKPGAPEVKSEEAFTRPLVAIEGHFQAGAGNHVPNGGLRPALAFAANARVSFRVDQDLVGETDLCFELALHEFGTLPGTGKATVIARCDGRLFGSAELTAPAAPQELGWSPTWRLRLPARGPLGVNEVRLITLDVGLPAYVSPLSVELAASTAPDGARTVETLALARPWLGIARPRIETTLAPPRKASGTEAPNVLFVCIETLRADVLGSGVTPFLDALAGRSLVCTQATAPAPWTLPSVASYFTGLRPYAHGARSELEDVLPDRCRTLAEVAGAAGIRTFAAVTNELLRAQNGFDAGFDTWQLWPVANAAAIDRLFLHWVDEHPGDRFFAYLHLFEPHVPLNAPGWRREADVPAPLQGRPYAAMERAVKREMKESGDAARAHDALEFLRGRYRGEVRSVDEQLARLCAELHRRGLWDRTLLIVTGDHGEEFGEHRWFGHGSQLYEESTHVPLLIHGPSIEPGRLDTPVESRIASSIAAAALTLPPFPSDAEKAVTLPLAVEGLAGLFEGSEVVCVTEKLIDTQSPGWPATLEGIAARITPRPGRSLRVGDSKLILSLSPPAATDPSAPDPSMIDQLEQFDLLRDPFERSPIRQALKEASEAIWRRVQRLRTDEKRFHGGVPSLEIAPEVLKVLKQHGYIDDDEKRDRDR